MSTSLIDYTKYHQNLAGSFLKKSLVDTIFGYSFFVVYFFWFYLFNFVFFILLTLILEPLLSYLPCLRFFFFFLVI